MSVDDSAYLLHLQRVNDYFRDNIEGVLVTLRQIEKLEPNAKLQKYEEGLNDTDPYFAKEYYFNKNGGQIYSGNSPPTEPLEHAHIDLMVAIIQLQGRSIDFQKDLEAYILHAPLKEMDERGWMKTLFDSFRSRKHDITPHPQSTNCVAFKHRMQDLSDRKQTVETHEVDKILPELNKKHGQIYGAGLHMRLFRDTNQKEWIS